MEQTGIWWTLAQVHNMPIQLEKMLVCIWDECTWPRPIVGDSCHPQSRYRTSIEYRVYSRVLLVGNEYSWWQVLVARSMSTSASIGFWVRWVLEYSLDPYRPYIEATCHVQRIFRSFDCRFIDLSLNITSTTTLNTIAVPLMTQIYHIYSIYHVFKVYVPVQRGNTREYTSTRVSSTHILASTRAVNEYSFRNTRSSVSIDSGILTSTLVSCTILYGLISLLPFLGQVRFHQAELKQP